MKHEAHSKLLEMNVNMFATDLRNKLAACKRSIKAMPKESGQRTEFLARYVIMRRMLRAITAKAVPTTRAELEELVANMKATGSAELLTYLAALCLHNAKAIPAPVDPVQETMKLQDAPVAQPKKAIAYDALRPTPKLRWNSQLGGEKVLEQFHAFADGSGEWQPIPEERIYSTDFPSLAKIVITPYPGIVSMTARERVIGIITHAQHNGVDILLTPLPKELDIQLPGTSYDRSLTCEEALQDILRWFPRILFFEQIGSVGGTETFKFIAWKYV